MRHPRLDLPRATRRLLALVAACTLALACGGSGADGDPDPEAAGFSDDGLFVGFDACPAGAASRIDRLEREPGRDLFVTLNWDNAVDLELDLRLPDGTTERFGPVQASGRCEVATEVGDTPGQVGGTRVLRCRDVEDGLYLVEVEAVGRGDSQAAYNLFADHACRRQVGESDLLDVGDVDLRGFFVGDDALADLEPPGDDDFQAALAALEASRFAARECGFAACSLLELELEELERFDGSSLILFDTLVSQGIGQPDELDLIGSVYLAEQRGFVDFVARGLRFDDDPFEGCDQSGMPHDGSVQLFDRDGQLVTSGFASEGIFGPPFDRDCEGLEGFDGVFRPYPAAFPRDTPTFAEDFELGGFRVGSTLPGDCFDCDFTVRGFDLEPQFGFFAAFSSDPRGSAMELAAVCDEGATVSFDFRFRGSIDGANRDRARFTGASSPGLEVVAVQDFDEVVSSHATAVDGAAGPRTFRWEFVNGDNSAASTDGFVVDNIEILGCAPAG